MKNKKIWFLLSLSCILAGSFLMLAGTLFGGIPGFYLDRSGIHTSKEAAEHKLNTFHNTTELDAFDSLELDISYAEDVELIPSDHYAVEYRISGILEEPVCKVENGRLIFQETPSSPYNDARIWFLYTEPGSSYTREPEPGPYYVKIEYPADQHFTDVVIRMESGNLKLPAMKTDTLDIRNDYGNVSLESYDGNALNLYLSSGNLTAGTVTAEQTQLKNEYGNVSLEHYMGKSLEIRMSSGELSLGSAETEQTEILNEYGDVLISQASGGSLTAELDSGSFLSDRLDFHDLKVKNEYGTIRVRLPGEISGYSCQLQTEYGSILLDGKRIINNDQDENENEIFYTSDGSNGKTVDISCDSGDIIINPAS